MSFEANERLAIGTLTKTALLANDAYLVANFPYADAPFRWLLAYDQIIQPYALRERTLAGTDATFGGLTWQWDFGLLSDRMLAYLCVDLAQYQLTPEVTVLTRNRLSMGGDQWVALNARMRIPDLNSEGLQPRAGIAFTSAVVTFFNARMAAP